MSTNKITEWGQLQVKDGLRKMYVKNKGRIEENNKMHTQKVDKKSEKERGGREREKERKEEKVRGRYREGGKEGGREESRSVHKP